MLPASYVLISSLGPTIPAVLGQLGISLTWKAPLFSTWLAARLVVFVALERWHGWHGRWWLPLTGGVGMLLGFALAVLSPRLGVAGMPGLFGGLGLFGVSTGLVYVASLYYGMEVGGSKVEDGGHHEAFIGLGYAGGPACGLAAVAIVGRESPHLDVAVVAIVGVIAFAAVVVGLTVAHRAHHGRSSSEFGVSE
jgi:MFS family permease